MSFKKFTLLSGEPCYIQTQDVVFFSTHPQANENECLIKLKGGHEIIVAENLKVCQYIFIPDPSPLRNSYLNH
ncbi:hypothetical protein [Flavobacterium hibernum]|uniref:Uncharacterized protein n=1 Tax=Flavobacterium hibernum TaxID=37752 RepID=A0A0D0EY95_9FLAO|nr:hypothetical protein [Flavobacterium hibernum]KIO54033.1 hypothetical protein IW18_03265 [Flavobacterium hibernum]OXA86754.1 hypothetical protein B0A73_13820 [Flavobacterium hibernum]STO18869.1 Uncharacterised protein [Flavobacterium hibernum]